MKRSKVIKLISDYFYESNVDPEKSTILAEELLAELESLGMLPPSTKMIVEYNNEEMQKGIYCVLDSLKWEKE